MQLQGQEIKALEEEVNSLKGVVVKKVIYIYIYICIYIYVYIIHIYTSNYKL
jgi:hypothetical protein